jgi:hypothetical protein
MAKKKQGKTSNYAVGYMKPPKETRFQKGKSGNPKGRPQGLRPVGSILQSILGQRITVTENGRTHRLPALEVMLRRLAADAMRNQPIALKLILSLVDRYGDAGEAALSVDQILSEDQAIMARYLAKPEKQTATKPKTKGKRDEW